MLRVLPCVVPWALVLLACDDVADEAPADAGVAASARLGPAGGVVRGPAGTEWAGFRLEVPAGALPREGEVGLRPAFDGAPLAATAERVGVQVEVFADVPFAAPVRLALPFDAGAVGRVGQGADDVKVWARTADGWALLEPVATGDADVTIELAAPTVAAAGVRLAAAAPTCADCAEDVARHVDPAACPASGLCLGAAEELPTLAVVQGAAPAAGVLGWITPAGQELRAEGFDPTTGTRHRGSVVSPRTSVFANVALGADGAVRLGLGSQGSARLPLLGGGDAVVRPAPGLGAISLGDGRDLLLEVVGDRLQLITDGTSNITDGTSNTRGVVINHEDGLRASVSELPTLAADPVRADRGFLLAGGGLYSFQLPPGAARVELVRRADAPGGPPLAPLALGAGPGGTVAAVVGGRGQVLVYLEQDNLLEGPLAVTLPFPARDVAFTPAGLVAVSATTPEVAVVDVADPASRRAPRLFALTDAAPDDAAWQAALPRQVLRGAGELWVRRADDRVVRVVPTP